MRLNYLAIILVFLTSAPLSPSLGAGGVVSVCDETHLLAALAGGGAVTFGCSGTIILTSTIVIAADTTIDGAGHDVTISGNGAVGAFHVNEGAALNLHRVTVANGYAVVGGGVTNNGVLTVSDSTFSGNRAQSSGGGIANESGAVVTVLDSTFSGNNAGGDGGGISSFGPLTVSNSIFSANSAILFGGGIAARRGLTVTGSIFSDNTAVTGGGLHSMSDLVVNTTTFSSNTAYFTGGGMSHTLSSPGVITVSNSTFFGNHAGFYGGGIEVAIDGDKRQSISNSSFSDNSADSLGGGIFFQGRGTVTITNSTLSGNRALHAAGALWSNDPGTIVVENTIVANSLMGGNCYGAIRDGGGNLSYPDTTCPGINSDPLLGPLQHNGGPTKTMEPNPGSAALDAGDDALCAANPINNLDQRGVARPQGARCDIGSVERLPYRTWLPHVIVE